MRAPVESLNVAIAAALDPLRGGAAATRCTSVADDRTRRRPRTRGRRRRPVDPSAPLAERMRPRTLDEFVGQEALLGARPAAARGDRARPPAVDHPLGPARHRQDDAGAADRAARRAAQFVAFSAVLSGIKEIRAVMAEAEETRRRLGRRTILFVDEIHRFNKAQQDAFLPRVEAGDIVLIGATTENPSFEVNSALLSRSKVYVLKPLDADGDADDPRSGRCAIASAASAPPSIDDRRRGAGRRSSRYANGDARVALNLLEMAAGARRAERTIDAGARRRSGAEPRAALRQDRRGALQPHLGAAQVDAQQRSRRGGLLAGAHARSGRGSALHRAAARALRVGGRRQRRSAGARRRGRGEGRGPLHRHARRQHRAGAGGDLPGDGAEEQRRLRRLRRGGGGGGDRKSPSRCRCTCATRRRG